MKQIPLAALALLLAACGSTPKDTAPPPSAQLPEAQIDPATAGTISGRVRFEGPAPTMPAIDMSSNPSCEREHKTPAHAQTIVLNPNRTLRYAFVWIKDGLPKAHWTPPKESVILTQSGCIYSPHVTGIMAGQTLEIVNDDPVNHNVHAESQLNPAWNIAEPPRAEHMFRRFPKEEVLIPVTCSVHPWMKSYVGVSPHPFYSVTGEDGTFTLRGVPPGTYTIEVVQEKLGKKQGTVTLNASGSATLDFTYGS